MFSRLWRVICSDRGWVRGELWISSVDKLIERTRLTTSLPRQGVLAADGSHLRGNATLNLNLDLLYNYAGYFCSS